MRFLPRTACGAAALASLLLPLGAPPARASSGEWEWPVHGTVITPYANDAANPYAGGVHRGIDIAARVGTAVRAAHGGRVTYAAPLGWSGLTVAVLTTGGRYVTSYLHLDAIAVRKDAVVRAGERLGAVGTTGRRSAEEPHLHFGIRIAGTEHSYVDPLSLLPPVAGRGPQPGAAPVAAPAPAALEAAPVPAPASVPRAAPEEAAGGAPARVPGGAPSHAPVRPLPAGRALPLPGGLPAGQQPAASLPHGPPGAAVGRAGAGLAPHGAKELARSGEGVRHGRPVASAPGSGPSGASVREGAGAGALTAESTAPGTSEPAGLPGSGWRLLVWIGAALLAAAALGWSLPRRLMSGRRLQVAVLSGGSQAACRLLALREAVLKLVACPATFDRKWRRRIAAMRRPRSPEYSHVFGLPASLPGDTRTSPFPGRRYETDH